MNIKVSPINISKWRMLILLLAIGSMAGATWIAVQSLSSRVNQLDQASPVAASEPTMTTVTALGRLEPEGEITHVAASSAGQRLAQVLVEEGDIVQVGQILAVLDSVDIRRAALAEATAKLETAQVNLARVEAGRKVGDINSQQNKVSMVEAQWTGDFDTQQATISQLEAQLRNAETAYDRHLDLYEEGAISADLFDTKRLELDSLQEELRGAKVRLEQIRRSGQAQLQAERETLNSLSEVRTIDVTEAEVKVREAMALLDRAEADLELAYVRSPMEGQVLRLLAKAGENVGSAGIAEVGRTQQMYAVAEVYETDIRLIQRGQSVTLSSEYGGFTDEIKGTVEQIALQIGKPGTVNNNPGASADVRVVEVKIRIDAEDSDRVKHLNQLQVRASIQI